MRIQIHAYDLTYEGYRRSSTEVAIQEIKYYKKAPCICHYRSFIEFTRSFPVLPRTCSRRPSHRLPEEHAVLFVISAFLVCIEESNSGKKAPQATIIPFQYKMLNR